MGYYDHSDRIRRGVVIFITALVSAVIGGMVVLTVSPVLVRAGVLPEQFFLGKGPSLAEEKGAEKTVSVNVDNDITRAVEKVRPAVVGVINYTQNRDPFSQEPEQQGTGSGIIFRKEDGKALVVTNYHVIKGASKVGVVIPKKNNEGKPVEAEVLGGDEATDLAVLQMPDDKVDTVAEFGNSDKLKAGEPAIAIGNPLGLEFSQSVTTGVISSPQRNFRISDTMSMDVIQTDAAINPGNSGGALVNAAGQVIGINSLKIAQQGIEGLGFAIPANDAKPIINDLIRYGEVRRPYLGIGLEDLEAVPRQAWESELNLPDNVTKGSVVLEVVPGSGADKGGLEARDVIVALDDQKIRSSSELRSYLWKEKEIGESIKITLYRDGKKLTKTVELTEAD
ncbi:S1C family serine protease [Paludifilum halophilum]|uniref:Peptidase S1 n=1 Tax=Paludifilum halophilum TaxID=1642702 RepID=A0A235B8P0_9BACL|nr:trypsin-like peptidase domain-containing protein [Paludifilum halophilum]OYD07945.1 peptidase S1 [Paludifilum halophilum]